MSSTPVHVDLLSFTYQRQIRQTGGDSRPTLEELCRHITPEHAANWRRIGVQLGIVYSDLNAIEQIYPGLHEICCNEMFEKWLQKEPKATWNDIFSAVGIESWYDNPDDFCKPTDMVDSSSSHSNSSTGFILGALSRHCILHVLTVIKEAMFKGNTTLLDNFIKDISELVKSEEASPAKPPPSSSNQYGAFKKLEPPPVIPVRAVQQFKNKAISTVEFAKLLESRLSSSASSAFVELDLEVLQRICWKYYLTEKTSTLPQCSWLNHSVCYQLFMVFNKMLGENYGIVVTGDRMNEMLEKITSSAQKTAQESVAYNSVHMTFDFTMYLLQIIACINSLKIPDIRVASIIRDIYEEEVNGVLKRGYLVKKGAKVKNWKKRWFVLKSDEMCYYESYENMILKGKIALNYHSDVLGTPDEKNKLFRFIVICGDTKRAFEMKAPDLQTKSEWQQAISKILAEKRETDRGGKPRSKSNPPPPRDNRYVISQSLSLDAPSHSSSVQSEDINVKLKNLSVDDASDSDSDCYVGPLELNRAVKMSYAEGNKNLDKSEHTDEYDYPYMEGIAHAVKSSPSQDRPPDVPVKTVRHNRVNLPKSASSDSSISPDYNTGLKKHELLSGPRHTNEQMVRASSQIEILEPLFEVKDYIKMHPDKTNSAMVKSHSYDEGRLMQCQSGTPGAASVNSPMEHNNYKNIDILTMATDDSVYTPLSPGEEEETLDQRTTDTLAVDNNTNDADNNLYLHLLAPSPEDLRRARTQYDHKLAKSSNTRHLPNTRGKPTTRT